MAQPRVAVAGAGVGGLTTALALAARGVRCTVFERSARLATDGFGIQLPPNATRVLLGLGLGPALDAVSLRPAAREVRRWSDGALLGRVPLGDAAAARYGAPYLALRRADLVRVLHEAAEPGTVRFGARCTAATPHGALHLADGSVHEADAVVGADGLRSVVRAALRRGEPRFTGYTAYRAVLPMHSPITGPAPVVTVWLGPGRHVVAYPVPGGLNLVAVTAGRLEGAFDGWHAPVRDLVRAAGPAGRARGHALFAGPALPAWHRGRLAVLGDAAHAMPPFLAQGAAQAIEDAAALAEAGPGGPGGLARYEARRRPRAERVTAASAAGGREHHLPDGARQRRRDERIAACGLPEQDWLFTCCL
ncbi:FAD-dependent monooxygenase [Dactylosporangium sp. NPDC051484]|uniref:FAD-dependent monooxygenase n=1 Tax=Dactylosporangium sp. NPDC051484 TaxID=3154942 RepID=UPI00344ECDFF